MPLTGSSINLAGLQTAATLTSKGASASLAELARANRTSGTKDRDVAQHPFWFHPEIQGEKWDQAFPYQLLVVDRTAEGWSQRGDWVYTLPLPPESITFDQNFAFVPTVTQGGIVEERNGSPLRGIEVTGTTGVLPVRPSAGADPKAPLAPAVLAGTLAAAAATADAARDVLADIAGGSRAPSNLIPRQLLDPARLDAGLLRNTGYWQIQTLIQFLEAYAQFASTKGGQNSVLALAVWKDDSVYLVSPGKLRIRKASDSPLEPGRYTLGLTAFARVKLSGGGGAFAIPVQATEGVNGLLQTLYDVRRTLQAGRDTLQAFVRDANETIFEPLRELALIVKDALAVPLTLADLPAAIVHDAADAALAMLAARDDVLSFSDDLGNSQDATARSVQDDLAAVRQHAAHIQDRTQVSTGIATRSAVVAGGGAARAPEPVTRIFDDPLAHAPFLGALSPDRLDLAPTTLGRIEAERQRVRRLTRTDLGDRLAGLQGAGATLDDAAGAGDPTFAQIYGRPAPAGTAAPSKTVFRLSAALTEAVTAYARATAATPAVRDAGVVASMEAFATRAAAAGIPFRVPRSKLPVPFPYGSTLEQLAQRYLDDPDRAVEIAALNGLRAPYVDEVGRALPLLVPGAGRAVVVADDPDLHVGMTVWVESSTVARTKRRVIALARLDGSTTLTLDGDPDLDRFSAAAGAFVHVFKPGTINSQMLVFIPSDQEPDGSFRVPGGVSGSSVFDPLLSVGGADLLLTPTNDLVVTPDGDGRWATGLTNLVQQFRILLSLRRGTLLRHPTLGLPLRPGDSVADVPAGDVVDAVRETLSAEPGFSFVKAVSVRLQPPGASLDVAVQVKDAGLVLPLSVDSVR